MKKRIWIPISILVLFVVVTVLALVGDRSMARTEVGQNAMQSTNLAAQARVTGDVIAADNLTDGTFTSVARTTKKDESQIVLDMGQENTINSIVLREDGLHCNSFEIAVSSDAEQYRVVHKGDKIEYLRYCTFDATACRYIRVTLGGDSGCVALREMEVYNEPQRQVQNFRVCGYYADNWSEIYRDPERTEEQKQQDLQELIYRYNVDKLTNMFLYCGMQYDASGNVFFAQDAADDAEIKQALKWMLTQIRQCAQRDIKLSLTFGAGSGNTTFLQAIGPNREQFCSALIATCNEIGFDGIDIDYEFPITASDYATFDSFLIYLKQRMTQECTVKDNALLSCAFGTKDITYSPQAIASLDMVNCMTYDIFDQDGQHSSFWGGGVQGGIYLQSMGFSKRQINLGIPFYGTQVDALMEQYLYKNLAVNDYYQNLYTVTDYLGKPTEVWFNSPSMARDKTAYAILAGYGGIMTWHSSLDLPIESEYSLWRAINTAVSQFSTGGAV